MNAFPVTPAARSKTVKTLLVGALLSAFAAASFAQGPLPPAGARPGVHHKHHGHKHHHHHHRHHAAHRAPGIR